MYLLVPIKTGDDYKDDIGAKVSVAIFRCHPNFLRSSLKEMQLILFSYSCTEEYFESSFSFLAHVYILS